jgi:hypothetical protein
LVNESNQTINNIDEKTAMQTGWKKQPQCHFVLQGRDGKMYCAYDYEQLRATASKVSELDLQSDSGLPQDYCEALSIGEIVKECTVKECPSLVQRIRNKL